MRPMADGAVLHCFIVLGRLFMGGSRGVGTWGVKTTPSSMGKYKAAHFLRNSSLEPMEKHKATDVVSSSDR